MGDGVTFGHASRENAPLWVIGAILVAAFAALAVFGRPHPAPPQTETAAGAASATPAEAVQMLPASADDNRVTVSRLAPDDARARNEAVPFAATTRGAARSFRFAGSATDRVRARDCLALAALAEAGAGEADQRAVMQVVLNRVRHPAFANTVCGVVFEGSERATGCQFSFTCDGSLGRTYSQARWSEARQRAEQALAGRTYGPVGNATHYHAEYVYPWWSGELDKIARVGPHLFFRWRGYWGTPAALSARYSGGEPDPMALRASAQAVERPEEMARGLIETGEAVRTITSTSVSDENRAADAAPGSPAPGVHFVLVSASDSPAALRDKARSLCPGNRYCQVYGWADPAAIPAKLPLSESARDALSFSFLPARGGQPEVTYFDCRVFESPQVGMCLPQTRR